MSRSNKRSLLRQENPPSIQALLTAGRKMPSLPGLIVSTRAVAPPALRTVLRYSARIVINNGLGLPNSYIFNGNSCFDPDFSGVGAQPLGFDQLSALYGRYRVLGSTIAVQMMTPAATTNAAAAINAVVCASNSSGTFSTVDNAAAQPVSQRKVFFGSNPSAKGSDFKLTSMTHLMHGVSPVAMLADDELSATTAANPAQLWYWHIVTEAVDRATATAVTCEVTIDYLVDFFEFVQGALSLTDLMSDEAIRQALSIRQAGNGNQSTTQLRDYSRMTREELVSLYTGQSDVDSSTPKRNLTAAGIGQISPTHRR